MSSPLYADIRRTARSRRGIAAAGFALFAAVLTMLGNSAGLLVDQHRAFQDGAVLVQRAYATDPTASKLILDSMAVCSSRVTAGTQALSRCSGPPGLPPPSAFVLDASESATSTVSDVLMLLAVAVLICFVLATGLALSEEWRTGALPARLAATDVRHLVVVRLIMSWAIVAVGVYAALTGLFVGAVAFLTARRDGVQVDLPDGSRVVELCLLLVTAILICGAATSWARSAGAALVAALSYMVAIEGYAVVQLSPVLARYRVQTAVTAVLRDGTTSGLASGGSAEYVSAIDGLAMLAVWSIGLAAMAMLDVWRRDLARR